MTPLTKRLLGQAWVTSKLNLPSGLPVAISKSNPGDAARTAGGGPALEAPQHAALFGSCGSGHPVHRLSTSLSSASLDNVTPLAASNRCSVPPSIATNERCCRGRGGTSPAARLASFRATLPVEYSPCLLASSSPGACSVRPARVPFGAADIAPGDWVGGQAGLQAAGLCGDGLAGNNGQLLVRIGPVVGAVWRKRRAAAPGGGRHRLGRASPACPAWGPDPRVGRAARVQAAAVQPARSRVRLRRRVRRRAAAGRPWATQSVPDPVRGRRRRLPAGAGVVPALPPERRRGAGADAVRGGGVVRGGALQSSARDAAVPEHGRRARRLQAAVPRRLPGAQLCLYAHLHRWPAPRAAPGRV